MIAAGRKQQLAKKAKNKTLALPQGPLRDEAGVAIDKEAVSGGHSIQPRATLSKEGTRRTASMEAHEPT